MKLRLLGVVFLAFAMMSWVACGGDDGGGNVTPTDDVTTDNNQPDATGGDQAGETTPPTDNGQETTPPTDNGQETTPPTDDGNETTPPTDNGQENPPTDVPVEACTPDCANKECGGDGCGGFCGSADGKCAEGSFCNDQQKCEVGTCTVPTTWGKAGYIKTMQAPDSTAAATACPDLTGDGKGDNGLAKLPVLGMINTELQKALDEAKFGVVMEFKGVADFNNTASFTLVGLAGEPDETDATKFWLEPAVYDADTCQPLISFPDSSIASGKLSTPPNLFKLSLPLQGMLLEMTLIDAQVAANITSDAVSADNGVLAGILTKKEVDAVIQNLKDQCAADPQDWCSYVDTAGLVLPMIYDTTYEGEQAATICMVFTLEGATVAGFKE